MNLPKDYKTINKGVVWVKVEEIKWLIDKETNIAIAEKGLLKLGKKEGLCNVKLSLVKKYLKKYFSKDIVASQAQSKNIEEEKADNIIFQIIMKKYNLMGEKAKIEKLKSVIENDEMLQRLMKKNNLNYDDVELDEEDNPVIRGLKF